TPTSVGVVTDEEIEDYAVTDVVDSFNRLANVRMLDSQGGIWIPKPNHPPVDRDNYSVIRSWSC
ncbi:MAG: Plug domain-containing protein, partial [Bacteroidota bacterium]